MKTASKELSQKLEEAILSAGYKQPEVYFRYDIEGDIFNSTDFEFDKYNSGLGCYGKFSDYVPAFTMCELWDMLPDAITEKLTGAKYKRSIIRFTCGYHSVMRSSWLILFQDTNFCNPLANMALWCIENNHPLNLPKK